MANVTLQGLDGLNIPLGYSIMKRESMSGMDDDISDISIFTQQTVDIRQMDRLGTSSPIFLVLQRLHYLVTFNYTIMSSCITWEFIVPTPPYDLRKLDV